VLPHSNVSGDRNTATAPPAFSGAPIVIAVDPQFSMPSTRWRDRHSTRAKINGDPCQRFVFSVTQGRELNRACKAGFLSKEKIFPCSLHTVSPECVSVWTQSGHGLAMSGRGGGLASFTNHPSPRHAHRDKSPELIFHISPGVTLTFTKIKLYW
jgi:hypothetical protein